MSEKVFRVIKEYRKMLRNYDQKAEFVRVPLFALKIIEKEMRFDKYNQYLANAISRKAKKEAKK